MSKQILKKRFVFSRLFIACFCLSLITGCQQKPEPTSESLLVFAAASLRDVMEEIADVYQQQTGTTVIFNFAGSNVLARQIAASPKADIFLSANTQWMDYLKKENRINTATQRSFLSNNLVFIAHRDSPFELSTPQDLMDLPFRFLSMGDPQAVPAGRYAKDYLSSIAYNQMNLWVNLTDQVLPAADVKAATAMVETMPDIIGLVYKTDALASSNIRILYEPQSDSLLQIQYIGATINKLLSSKSSDLNLKAIDFLNFLSQAESTAIFQNHGFLTLKNLHIAETRGMSH